jgi:phosphoribosyl-ATP pyrophosphohydrolase/phosphoribosyl-AMP cyclohydrolase
MMNESGFLQQLEQVIAERRSEAPEGSYTASLLASGRQRIAQKVGEEGVELALAGVGDDRARVVSETADLLYHVLVLLAVRDISLNEVLQELERRHHP